MKKIHLSIVGLIFMVGLPSAQGVSETIPMARSQIEGTSEFPLVITPREMDYDQVFRNVDESDLKQESGPTVNYFLSYSDNGFTHIAANAWPSVVYWPHHVWDYPFYWNMPYSYDVGADASYATLYPHQPYWYGSWYRNPYHYRMSAVDRYEMERLNTFFNRRYTDDVLSPDDLPSAGLDSHDLAMFGKEEAYSNSNQKQQISIMVDPMYYYNGDRNWDWYNLGLGMFYNGNRGYFIDLNTSIKVKSKSKKENPKDY